MHGDFYDDEINELYNHPKVKAHINITHGEGFGRPLLESSLSGKPIITSSWSGHMDFLNSKSSILISGNLVDVPKSSFPENMYVKGAQWFTVNYELTSKSMLNVFTNYKKFTMSANKLARVNSSLYSLKKMGTEFEKILDKYLPDFPKEVKLELPKLKKVNNKSEPSKIKLPKLKRI